MKAVRYHEQGGLEKLRVETIPEPAPEADQVIIEVEAVSVNRTLDIETMQTGAGWQLALPHIPGADPVGTVTACGSAVRNFQQGDRVATFPWLHCGDCRYCRAGQQNSCRSFAVYGVATQGGYAEYAAVPAANLVKLPAGIPWTKAAAVPVVYQVAWHLLVTRAKLSRSDTVLILAAGGGLGTAMIDICRDAGARMIAAAGSDAKLARLEQLGVQHSINYHKQDLIEAVLELTDGHGVDIVAENIGAETFDASVQVLAKEGRLVNCAAVGGAQIELDIRDLYRRNLSFYFACAGTRDELQTLYSKIARGELNPVIDSTYPLDETANAWQRLLSRNICGKVILQP